jgi:hypothetical protein
MTDLAALIESRLMELLDGGKEPECATCGRKPISPAQMTQALRVGLQFLATNQAPPGGPAPGSGFKEDEDDVA